jgi:hypothetical protein
MPRGMISLRSGQVYSSRGGQFLGGAEERDTPRRALAQITQSSQSAEIIEVDLALDPWVVSAERPLQKWTQHLIGRALSADFEANARAAGSNDRLSCC